MGVLIWCYHWPHHLNNNHGVAHQLDAVLAHTQGGVPTNSQTWPEGYAIAAAAEGNAVAAAGGYALPPTPPRKEPTLLTTLQVGAAEQEDAREIVADMSK